MEFDTDGKATIESIFSTKKRIVIPRFQREFVWDVDDKLTTFWEDILDNLNYNNAILTTAEYFLGTLVLIDNKNDPTEKNRAVVDGQQRLTVITIFFSALYETFLKTHEDKLAEKIFDFIITEDNDGNPITLLNTESPKPFFQLRIQQKEKDTDLLPKTLEEKRLYDAYNFFIDKLKEERLRKDLSIRTCNIASLKYVDILKIIRDQVLQCKVVYVSVKSMKDAYMIFEVLNAKGEPLSTVELIKNSIFKILSDTEPLDTATEIWSNIKRNIENEEELEVFYRHYWLSKYKFVTQKKLFQDFEDLIPKKKNDYKKFLNGLSKASLYYNSILKPKKDDWKTVEKIPIYYSLEAFTLFNVTQVRTIILALLELNKNKMLNVTQLKDTLLFLENFHFVFSAICSARPSGLERRYSKYAILLHKEKDKSKIKNILTSLKNDLKTSVPQYEIFQQEIEKLYFTEEKDKDKKKIQYIFSKIERFKQNNFEFDILPFTLEHIYSQKFNKEFAGKIGNLLPLSEQLNGNSDIKPFKEKLKEYRKSNLKTVKDFVSEYTSLSDWNETAINNRTKDIASYLYNDICNF